MRLSDHYPDRIEIAELNAEILEEAVDEAARRTAERLDRIVDIETAELDRQAKKNARAAIAARLAKKGHRYP